MASFNSPEIPGYSLVMALSQSERGGVYLALEQASGRELVLKLIRPECQREVVKSGLKVLEGLVHPHLVSFRALGIHQDWAYLAMEHLPGRRFEHRRFEWDFNTRLGKLKPLAEALDFMAERGYLIADVCPENILLTGSDEQPVLLGFTPCPRIVDPALTPLPPEVFYRAPECLSGAPLDGCAYVYSLGILLYLLLQEHLPFQAVKLAELQNWQQNLPPLLPAHLSGFQPLINASVTLNPEHRYPDCHALITALESLSPETLQAAEQGAEKFLLSSSHTAVFSAVATSINRQFPMAVKLEPMHASTQGESFSAIDAFHPEQPHSRPIPEPRSGYWPIIGIGSVIVVLLGYAGCSFWKTDEKQPAYTVGPGPTNVGAETVKDKPVQDTVLAPQDLSRVDTFPNLEEQARWVRIRLKEDLSSARELMVIYRAALRGDDPVEQAFARLGLEDLQAVFALEIGERLAAGDKEGAQGLAEQITHLFDSEEWSPSLSQAMADIED